MDRSVSQWALLATLSGFHMDEVISCPSSPSLNITVLSNHNYPGKRHWRADKWGKPAIAGNDDIEGLTVKPSSFSS
jgi:hypothetical protein